MRASGARKDATCVVASGTVVRYDAGAGAPWVDACQVPVRLAGQDEWTYLSVPILVRALDPQPELRAGSMTVGPGETATFDLRDMTTWQLREDWAGIEYAVDYSGAAFDVSLNGSIVTVTGADRAVPGAEEAATGVGDEPQRRRTGASDPARRIGAVDAPAGRLALEAVQRGSRQLVRDHGSSARRAKSNPLPRTPLEVSRGAARPARARA